MLEPNVKDGCGGLRDLQTAVWAARVKFKCRTLRELQQKGVIDVRAAEGIRHVTDYLLRIRNELHYTSERSRTSFPSRRRKSLPKDSGTGSWGRASGWSGS